MTFQVQTKVIQTARLFEVTEGEKLGENILKFENFVEFEFLYLHFYDVFSIWKLIGW